VSRNITKKVRAIWDVIELAERIGQDSPDAAVRFMDAVEDSLKFLLRFPEMAAVWEPARPHYEGMRVWPVSGFPHHLIFYRPVADGIEVIRVCHSSRNLDRLFSQ
jgi:toxin ParE1/3/4